MDADVVTVDYCCKWQLLEHVHCLFIALLIVQKKHLLSEIVSFSAVTRLMVSTQQENVVWVANLQAEKVGDDFCLVLATVDIVTEEDHFLVMMCTWKSDLLHDIEHVKELSMDVAHNAVGMVDAQQVRLPTHDGCSFLANCDESVLFDKSALE